MELNEKEYGIVMLLRDYMNFLPSGQQEAFVPAVSAFGNSGNWPVTVELEKRMDTSSMVGETYAHLDSALNRLAREEPILYNALLVIYLREEAGHRDLDKIKAVAAEGNLDAARLVSDHNQAITKLARMLDEQDLYIRMPHKATGPRPGQDMVEMHNELFAVFWRDYEHGEGNLPYRKALANSVLRMDNYYTRRHADRIIKKKLQEINED